MLIRCVWEHNGGDTLLYSDNFIGAFTRGSSRELALDKMPREIGSYLRWLGQPVPEGLEAKIMQEKASGLIIRDADSDVIFDTESAPLTPEEYRQLKALALRSARDFHRLYEQMPDKDRTSLAARRSFYGDVPVTARQMYEHTKNVNAYYFGEINIGADNEGTIYDCRSRGFELLEQTQDYLSNRVLSGSYDEIWSLRKVFRRFVWHDRIHAKAMYKMAIRTFGNDSVTNIFKFDL